MRCEVCNKEANSFIACQKDGAICMDHCKRCEWFTGGLEWGCLYKEKQISKDTRGYWDVEKFRNDLEGVRRKYKKTNP